MYVTSDYPEMIFRTDNDYGTFYQIGLSKKNQDGSYENGYINCQFKKGVSLENQTKIYIKKAWLSFYKKDKTTVPYIFISEFETVAETIEKSKEVEEDPFASFGKQIQIEDDLPF